MRRWLGIAALFWLEATNLVAAPLSPGRGQMEINYAGAPVALYTYKPAGYNNGPLLVVFHGVMRNADQYLEFAIPIADRLGMLLVAPRLDEGAFPEEEWYQRGGVLAVAGRARPKEQWMFNVVGAIVADVRAREEKPTLPYFLIGHSAGAQFLVRLAAFQPGEARRIVAGNAGSLLFPSTDHAFGYGLGGLPPELRDETMVRRYLAAPLTLYLGLADTTPRRRFDASEAGMKQGPHRLARNRAGFALAEAMAKERGWTFGWRKVEVPGIEHDAARMFAADAVEDALLGPK
jgi:poly(3-hydroxybutyrate) depolymerase